MTPEQLYKLIDSVLKDYAERINSAQINLKETIKEVKNEFRDVDKIHMDDSRRNNRRNWKLF